MHDLGKTHIFKNSSTTNREDDLLWEAKRAANAAKKQTREENQEPNETLQKVKTYTYLALGTVVLAGSLWGGYKVWRRRKDKKEVELAALEYYSADYAIQFAKAFANFGGVGEVLYDVADELLPTFLSEYLIGKDSDWEKVEKIANSMAVDNINEKNTITPNMFAWFEQYTKKEFHDVAKKVLEGNQYDKLLTILAKQKTADFAPNDVSTTQNNAYAWSSGGIVKYDIQVGQMATQHDLKGKIVFIRADAPASVEVKAHFETNANNTKAFLMTFQREGTPSNIAAAGALMGINVCP